jgi:RimJ/RimL family protein N-acetyltransferase
MERLLIFIKHHVRFLWRMIEWGNGLVFSILYRRTMLRVLPEVFAGSGDAGYLFRPLELPDAGALFTLIDSQDPADLKYFSPHGFDLPSIARQFRNRSFLMMGVFDRDRLAGYFFLRFFASKKCFVGRLIDRDYRGKGIGVEMNRIMYGIAWAMGFRCLSTMSKNNRAVIRAHSKNSSMVVLKELQDDYILVEFVNRQDTMQVKGS